MKTFKKTGKLVFAILFSIILVQLFFDYAVASTGDMKTYQDKGADDSFRIATDSQPQQRPISFAPTLEYLYGTTQSSTVTLTNPSNSIDSAFNDSVASAQSRFAERGESWTFTVIDDATVSPMAVSAEVRFYLTSFTDDPFSLDIYDGSSWTTLETFTGSNTPPSTITTNTYDVWAILSDSTKVNAAQLRFVGGGQKIGGRDDWVLYVDGVRLIVTEAIPVVNQEHYRIGNDEPLSDMTWKGGVDQRIINFLRETSFRVRFQVYNSGTSGKEWTPRLDWSSTNGTGYAAVPTTSGSDPFFLTDTAQFTNRDNISTAYFGLGSGTGIAVGGIAYDTENPASSNITLAGGYYTEVEYNIQSNTNASYNGSYYFRLSDNGTALYSYDVTEAEIRIQEQPSASDPHNTYSTTTDKCASCHRTHTGSGPYLRKASTEEGVCLSCHDGTGASTDISSQFGKTYRHPVASQSWIHTTGENTSGAFSGGNRHVECADCHRPHSIYPGGHDPGSNIASLVLKGTSGISVNNNTAWTTPTYTFESSITYEYELCFKCHSYWAYGASPPNTPSGFWDSSGNTITATQTDPSVEFNALNRSHHAVEGVGNNQPAVSANPAWPSNGLGLSNNFVSPWTATSTVQCNDCHTSDTSGDPSGPHGSAERWMIRKNETGAGTPEVFCYNCHRREVYGDIDPYALTGDDLSGNDYHLWPRFPHRWFLAEKGAHIDPANQNRWGIWCMTCHGGDGLGGIHGTNRSDVGVGVTPIGDQFMNGATIAGWTRGTTTADSGEINQKGSTDEVDLCAEHGGKSWTANFD